MINLIEKIDEYLTEAADQHIIKAKGDVYRDNKVLFKDTPFSFAFDKTKKGDIKGLSIYPEHRDAYNVVKGRGITVSYSKKEMQGLMMKMSKKPELKIDVINLPPNPTNKEKDIDGVYGFSFKVSNLKEVQDFYSAL